MASLIKRENSPYWYCKFRIPETDASGERKWRQYLRNTKVRVKDEKGSQVSAKASQQKKDAQGKAEEIEKAYLAEQGAGDGSVKQLAILRQATEMAARGQLTESVTRQFLLDIYAVTAGEKLEVWTVREWVSEWLDRKDKTTAKGSRGLHQAAANSLLEYLGSKADARIELLTTSELRKWRDWVKDEGRTGKTTNLYLKAIRNLLKIAWQEDIILKNPADPLETLPEEDSIEKLPFTLDEIKALMGAANPEWKLVMGIAFYTGLRLTDITRLEWDAVDLEGRQITVSPKKQRRMVKRKKVLVLPVPDPLNALFNEYAPQDARQGPVFPPLHGHQSSALSKQFSKIMEKAGVDPQKTTVRKTTRQGAGATVSAKSFHSFRHSQVSFLANAGVAQEVRQQFTGHSSDVTHQGYTHLELETLRSAVGELPDINQAPDEKK